MGKLVGERRREKERERERERDRERGGSETDVPKLYPTMNMNSLCKSHILEGSFY